MTKKNKHKRKIQDNIVPNLFWDGGKAINLSNMYTQNMNLSSPQLSQSGLPSSYQVGQKYQTTATPKTGGANSNNVIGNPYLAPVYGAAAGMGFDAVDTMLAGGKSSTLGTGAVNTGATLMTAGLTSGNPALMLAGGIAGTAGTVINALFGSKLNKERIAQAENEINKANRFNADASNFDDLSQMSLNAPAIAGFKRKDIGSDGLFSNKAKNKYNELLAQKQRAEDWIDRSIENNATNLQQNQMNNLLQNYAAFGGPLGYGFDGALGYDLANQQLGINAMKAMSQNRQYSVPNMGLNTFAEGGGIHIAPSKRGTFTAAAKKHGKGVQEFARQVLANKENYSPAMIKKANFARNAAKWKHAFGGDLITNGGVFSNNVTIVKNGGSHNENPYEGVQMGVDPQGIPNLVEENEVIWNDYVFSDRIKVPKTVKEKQKLRGNKNMTFADAANKIQKISEERPNDPISMETMNINLTRLAQEQEALRQQRNLGQEGRKYAKGGTKRNKSTIPSFTLGTGWQDDFTDSRLDTMYATNNTNPLGLTKDDFAKVGMVDKDPYANVTFNKNNNNSNNNNYATWLRYAPVVGSAIGLGQTLLSSPDYSRADALAQYAQNAGQFQPITYNPLGNYLTYNPTDINYQANRAAAQAGATRRDIMNTAGGNRAAAVGSLLAADYNAQLAQGELLRQAEEANFNRRSQVEAFNRATNQTNSEMALKAAMANQEARLKASQMGLSGYTTAMQMKDAIDAQRNASINANLSSLFESLGNIGVDEYNRMDRDMLIKSGVFGTLNDAAKRAAGIKSSKGGKLNRKKRGGFTY